MDIYKQGSTAWTCMHHHAMLHTYTQIAKANPRWLWHAVDHHTGKVLAYVFGRRQDDVFLQLQQLLAPFGITKFYTDAWGPPSGISMLSNIRWVRSTRRKSRANMSI